MVENVEFSAWVLVFVMVEKVSYVISEGGVPVRALCEGVWKVFQK